MTYELCPHGRHVGAYCEPCAEARLENGDLLSDDIVGDADQKYFINSFEYVDPYDMSYEPKEKKYEEPFEWAFSILDMDEKLGRPTKAEDITPLTKRQLRARTTAKSINDPAIAAIYAQVPALQDLLGVDLHVDHMVPLSKGGKHCADNLQIVPKKVNLRKSDEVGKKYGDYND